MSVHRVRVPALSAQMSVPAAALHHLRVMRLALGDRVRVFDGQGAEAEATIERLDEGGALLLLGERVAGSAETPQPVTLAVALLKGDKLSDVVRAATELGAATIQLLTTRYADVPDIGETKLTRLRRVAEEASRQSRRAVVPEVRAPMPLHTLVLDGAQGFLAHPGSAARLTELLRWDAPVTLVSGPEGGFSDDEVARLLDTGFTAVTLGPRILRAETAPLALLGALAASGV